MILLALYVMVARTAVPDTTVLLARAERDLTGDGKPEVMTLVGVGKTLDSLDVTFSIESGGRRVYRAPIRLPTHRAFDRTLRRTLGMEYSTWLQDVGRSFFAETKFQTPAAFVANLRDAAPGHIADIANVIARDGGFAADTARSGTIWRHVQASRAVIFEFSRGGDDAGAIVWSVADGRFYRIFECC